MATLPLNHTAVMHKLARPSVAASACPSAPFLAPRRLCSLVAMAPNKRPSAPRAAYAANTGTVTIKRQKGIITAYPVKSSMDRRSDASRERPDVQSPLLPLLKQLDEACELRDARKIMELYPALLEAGVLYDSRHNVHRIAQALHVRLRYTVDDADRADLLAFADQVAADLRNGAIAPFHMAYVHLLGMYKDSQCYEKGRKLWLWLMDQNEDHVSAAVYGAAIELMAYGRILGLSDLERLYAEALRRFPGTFAAYHLSPDAVVPDRCQPTLIPGIPMILLQGILTARLLARDWKNAYLALHTALRLYPDAVPPRFFELFMSERPLAEGYAAYMLACRAGVIMRPTHVTALFTKIRAAIGSMRSMADRMLLIRAIVNALYATVEAGGELEGIYVAILIQSMTQLLPDGIPHRHVTPDEAELRDAIVATVHDIVSGLAQAGMEPQVHLFGALFAMSGKLHVPDLLTTTLQSVKTAGLENKTIAIREAITAAGFLGNTAVIEYFWGSIAKDAKKSGIRAENWIALTKACQRAGHQGYWEQQVSMLGFTLPNDGMEDRLRILVNRPNFVPGAISFNFMSIEDLTSELKALKNQMVNVEAVLMSGKPLNIFRTPFYMHLNPHYPSLGSLHDLQAVYDQYSLDPHQPPPPPPVEGGLEPIHKSPTMIPLDKLRFWNWITVFEMMDDAEAYEIDRKIQMETAVSAGRPIPENPELLRLHQDAAVTYTSITSLRSRIASLRAPTQTPTDAPRFRYTASKTPKKIVNTPMTYDESRGKWRRRSGRLIKYTNPPQSPDLQTASSGAIQIPTLAELESMNEGKSRGPNADG